LSAAPPFPPDPGPPSGPTHLEPTSGLPHLDPHYTQPSFGGPPSSFGSPATDRPAEPVRHATEQLDRAALRRPSGGSNQVGEGVYRSSRPGTATVLIVITVLFEVVALRLLATAFFAHPIQVGGSIASAFLALGLPMFGLGMYGLLGGGAAAPGAGARVWLRTPLVYLPVALTLFLAAGLAAT
jgi:hypothetical protein